MIYLYFMSLFLLTMYIMYAVRVCGVSWSLSDTYYQLKKRNRPAWLFQAAMVVPAMLLIPVWIDCSNESFQFLAFLACGGLMFVGTAPLFKEEFQSKVHYVGTVASGLANSLGMFCRDVVSADHCIPDCRTFHIEIPEMAVLGRVGCVCLCLCGSVYNLYQLLDLKEWE